MRARFTTNYRTAEDGVFYIDYKIVRFTTNFTMAEVYLQRSYLIKGRKLVVIVGSQSRFSSP